MAKNGTGNLHQIQEISHGDLLEEIALKIGWNE